MVNDQASYVCVGTPKKLCGSEWPFQCRLFFAEMLCAEMVWNDWQFLKESATNEKTWTVFVQDVSHNINLTRIGKWRRLNMISRRLNIPTQRFLFAWVFGLVPVFVSALPGALEPGSRTWRHLRSFCVYWECVKRIVNVSRIILECTLYYYFVSIIGLYIE